MRGRAAFAAMRAFTIRLMRAGGIGFSGVKWMPPFVRSKPLSCAANCSLIARPANNVRWFVNAA